MKTLQDWLEDNEIDSNAGICVSLTTTGFVPSKGRVAGIHICPLWNNETHTLLVSGSCEPSIVNNMKYTGLPYDAYSLRARGGKAVNAKIAEILEYTHYVVVYNKKFFTSWIGANECDALRGLEDFPQLDICNVAKAREEGDDFSGLSFDTVFELDDFLRDRYGTLKKTPFGSCGFHQLVPRYVQGSVRNEPCLGKITGDCNAENLRQLTKGLLLK